jgi:biotin carboxyl carrier protein
MKYIAEVNGKQYQIELFRDQRVEINGEPHQFSFDSVGERLTYSLLVDGQSFEVNLFQENGSWEVIMRGRRYSVRVEDERERLLREAGGDSALQQGRICLEAPMPGLVIDIPVSEGSEVEEGEVLLVLESMKMQNELIAPRKGTVTGVRVEVNQNVERGQTLLVIE